MSMPKAVQEQMLVPMYSYAVPGVGYQVAMPPGSIHMRYLPPTLGPIPNGRIYQQQQPMLPMSGGAALTGCKGTQLTQKLLTCSFLLGT